MSFLNTPVTRRRMLKLAGGSGVLGLAGAGWTASMYQSKIDNQLQLTKYDLHSARWSEKPLKIAFVTDVHVGCSSVDLDVLRAVVKQTNALHADIILLGGDFQTNLKKLAWRNYVPPQPIADVIGQLKAPLGTYAVLGNHDWHTDGPGMRKALEDQGIPVLENESLRVNQQGYDFWLVGLADFQTRKPDYKQAVVAIDTDAPRIVLSHDPYTFAAVDNDITIQLSGHTHGGQVVFPLIGPVVKATQEAPLAWSYGLINHEQRQMIVSSGVGTSILPFKNTPNEIVQLTLSRAQK